MRLFTVFFIMLVFSACGKTGELYLPDENPPTDEPSAKPATAAEK